jgi:hypothetical protein
LEVMEDDFREKEIKSLTIRRVSIPLNVWAISAAPNGDVFVAGTSILWKIDSNGELVKFCGNLGEAKPKEGHRLTEASFGGVSGLFASSHDVVWFVSDNYIWKIAGDQAELHTGKPKKGFLDGPRKEAEYAELQHLVERNGTIYATDVLNHRVRVISPEGMVSSIGSDKAAPAYAYDGPFGTATFYYPRGIALGPGNTLLVSSTGRQTIRCVDLDQKRIYHVAGGATSSSRDRFEDGEAQEIACFDFPVHLAYSPSTDEIIVADSGNKRLRRIQNGMVSTLVEPTMAKAPHSSPSPFTEPRAVCITEDGTLIWSERFCELKYMSSFGKPSGANFPDFGVLLEKGQFSDFSFIHRATNTPFNLHKPILQLWGINLDHFASLQDYKSLYPIQTFITCLYSYNSINSSSSTLQAAIKLAHFHFIASRLELDEFVIAWSFRQFTNSVSFLNLTEMIQLLSTIESDCNANEELIEPISSSMLARGEELGPALLGIGIDPSSSRCPDLVRTLISESSNIRHKHESDEKTGLVLPTQLGEAPAKSLIAGRLKDLFDGLLAMQADFRSMRDSQLAKEPRSAFPDLKIQPDFELKVPALTDSKGFSFHCHVHSWLLYCRWRWFETLVDSGLQESRTGVVEMPSDFPPSLLASIIEFFYCSSKESSNSRLKRLSSDDTEFLNAYAAMYRLDEPSSGMEVSGFLTFMSTSGNRLERLSEKQTK